MDKHILNATLIEKNSNDRYSKIKYTLSLKVCQIIVTRGGAMVAGAKAPLKISKGKNEKKWGIFMHQNY